jgi:hypothetical protein
MRDVYGYNGERAKVCLSARPIQISCVGIRDFIEVYVAILRLLFHF